MLTDQVLEPDAFIDAREQARHEGKAKQDARDLKQTTAHGIPWAVKRFNRYGARSYRATPSDADQ